ncbi:ASCH domain-containing protein [Acinetobacter bohemicus]|nr:ASCH domain-containing protein [Acinetobacter sp. S4397-1]MCO8044840.1 ASCH domain-containing protein [Acinetobacter sp. S4397-1]
MSIVLSIKPQFTNLILEGKKTIELRTKIGKKFSNNADLIIYSSSPVKAIVAIAKVHKIQNLRKDQITSDHFDKICISSAFFQDYMQGRESCYLMELKDVNKLTNPIALSDLKKLNFTAPQSFCYASEDLNLLVNSHL